jgi:hypothetical protein
MAWKDIDNAPFVNLVFMAYFENRRCINHPVREGL